jgi:hypothetical protein
VVRLEVQAEQVVVAQEEILVAVQLTELQILVVVAVVVSLVAVLVVQVK